MSEFSLINRFCLKNSQSLGVSHPNTDLNIGDDGAVVSVPEGKQLVVSVDTMVEGVHFFPDVDPSLLAYKLLAVNVSDMAAMGAKAQWATLAMTLSNENEAWLRQFSQGLDAAATNFEVELIGGDTTRGALTLSLQIMGLVDAGQAIKRSGAKQGDVVFVTGNLGDAALALKLKKAESKVPEQLLAALEQPKPPFQFAANLPGLVSSAIDISDGLAADLGHIATMSKVGIEVDLEQIPVSKMFREHQGELGLAISGGDDYQLALTAPPDSKESLMILADSHQIKLSEIGRVVEQAENSVLLRNAEGRVVELDRNGFEHF